MTQRQAFTMQQERYRQMTGEERFAVALRMHEFACEITLEEIRFQFPQVSPERQVKRLRDRIHCAQVSGLEPFDR